MEIRGNILLKVAVLLIALETVSSSRDAHSEMCYKLSHYNAAVVEYQSGEPRNASQPMEILKYNADAYRSLISKAANQGAHIIVFPEYGLTSLEIPSDRKLARPYLLEVPLLTNPCSSCTDDNGVLKELSCTAKDHNVYVVVNLGEIEYCTIGYQSHYETFDTADCPSDGVFQYNTNIVFDNKGTIIARYRKMHLFGERRFNTPSKPELSTFMTDFGVEFGMFTCFDILFKTPSVDLVSAGIKNFVFPTAWIDELPFLTAIQSQASWAFGTNSNLLSSGYHDPQRGHLGSGIYSGTSGALNYTFDPDSGTQIIMAKVPVEPLATEIEENEKAKDFLTSSHQYLKEDLGKYTTKVLEYSEGMKYEEACQDGFCCELKYIMENNVSFKESGVYRLAVRNGSRSVIVTDITIQICAIIRCFDDTLSSCSGNERENVLPNFLYIKLKASPFTTNCLSITPNLNTIDVNYNLIPYDLFVTFNNISSMIIESDKIKQIKLQTVGITHIVH